MSEASEPLIHSHQHSNHSDSANVAASALHDDIEPQNGDDSDDVNNPGADQDAAFEDNGHGDDVEVEIEESGLRRPTLFVWVLALVAGISGLLFGYDTGVISATLVSIGPDLSDRLLTTADKSLVTSCTALFALISSPLTGILADRIGRKKVILVADVLFIVGAFWQAQTGSVWGMIGGRSIIGLAVGGASLVVPMYISELSPSPFRGRLVTLSILFITLGQVIAYVIGYLFSTQLHGWRWMVGLGGLPAAIQALLLLLLPESPRWLVKADKTDAARKVLDKVFGKGADVQRLSERVLRGIAIEIQQEEASRMRRSIHQAPAKEDSWLVWIDQGWTELFRVPGNRRALAIACLLQGLQQLCGFNSLMYFAATIFSLVGFTSPVLTALYIACTNFVFTLLALVLIDRIGRRKMLLYSISPMVVALCLCAIAFFFIQLPRNKRDSIEGSAENRNIVQSRPAALTILASLVIYVAGYALGLGNVPWQQSELFPLSVRSVGSSLSTATNWGSNFVVGLTFLPMMEFLTPMATFGIYAAVCTAGWLLVRRIYPETKGMSLEEVGSILADGWGVEESLGRVGSK